MSSTDTVLQLLKQSSLGAVLNDHLLTAIVQIGVHVHQPAGSVLFKEGASASSLWVVCSGSVALDMQVPLRGSVRVLTLGQRDLLGWSAMVGDGAMSTTATVTEDAELLRFPAQQLKDLCLADHTLGYAVMEFVARAVANRLRGTRLQLLDLYAETLPNSPSASGAME